MRIIRTGISRTVILTRRYAIKVPSLRGGCGSGPRGRLWSFAHGILANLSEREWSDTPDVCPVLWCLLGLVNIYPRCEPLPEPCGEIDYDAIGIVGPAGDKKPDNLGLLDGRIVWIDYDMSGRDPRLPCRSCADRNVAA